VKVGERGQSLTDDLARVEAVRDALGQAVRCGGREWCLGRRPPRRAARLDRFDLEYAEQPCASVEELAQLRLRLARARVDVPIAADESIRRSEDPYRVAELAGRPTLVLKVTAARRESPRVLAHCRADQTVAGGGVECLETLWGFGPGWRLPRRYQSCPTPAG
jgi:O-succinylbenzoate synthase